MNNNLFNVGETVIYNRGEKSGKSKIVKIIRVEMAGYPYNGVWRYRLEDCIDGEIFDENELKKAE